MPKNGTSDAETKKRRPLFNANIPPIWCIAHLFYAIITCGWVLSQFSKIDNCWSFFSCFYLLNGQKTKSAQGQQKERSNQKVEENKPALKLNFLSYPVLSGSWFWILCLLGAVDGKCPYFCDFFLVMDYLSLDSSFLIDAPSPTSCIQNYILALLYFFSLLLTSCNWSSMTGSIDTFEKWIWISTFSLPISSTSVHFLKAFWLEPALTQLQHKVLEKVIPNVAIGKQIGTKN